MSGKIRVEHTQPATGSPEQDMAKAQEYLLVTKRGNEVMVAYSHEHPEDSTPLLMEAANLLGRFNQIQMMARAAQSFGQGQGMAGSGFGQGKAGPNPDNQNIQRGPMPGPMTSRQDTGDLHGASHGGPDVIGVEAEDLPETEVERELDQY